VEEAQGREVRVAVGFRSRLLGLARLRRDEVGAGLLIPRCSSVHTFGMRFALDVVFLNERGETMEVRREVPPCRFASHPGAVAILEVPSGQGGEFPGLLD
jgi:uncharacterized protein